MALNFSHRPIFLDGVAECHGDRFCNPLRSEGDVKDCFYYGRDRNKSGSCSQESDILDRLPSDPFGMEISTAFTASAGWLSELEMDYGGYGRELVANNAEDYQLYAGLNILWNNAMVFHTFPGLYGFDCNTHFPSVSGGFYGTMAAPVGGFPCWGFGPENGPSRCLDSNGKGSALSYLGFGSSSRFEEFSEMKVTGESSYHGRYGSANSYAALLVEREISVMFDSASGFGQHYRVNETRSAASSVGFMSVEGFEANRKMNGYWTSEGRSTGNSRAETVITGDGSSNGDGLPHMALTFVLSYLSIKDLLSVERVCKFFRSTIQTDPLLWRTIQIKHPLNEKITDDVLLQLSARAQGKLINLSLVDCWKITYQGLKLVVQSNPRLTKLSVPGCTRIRINHILDILKTLKSIGSMKVTHLRVGDLFDVKMEQFEDLKTLLGLNNSTQQQNAYKPHLFNRDNKYLSFEDNDRNLDLEVCPRCVKLGLVYNCPTDACRPKEGYGDQSCRACRICIPRCYQCGRCINDDHYDENFFLEMLCFDCSFPDHLKRKLVRDNEDTIDERSG